MPLGRPDLYDHLIPNNPQHAGTSQRMRGGQQQRGPQQRSPQQNAIMAALQQGDMGPLTEAYRNAPMTPHIPSQTRTRTTRQTAPDTVWPGIAPQRMWVGGFRYYADPMRLSGGSEMESNTAMTGPTPAQAGPERSALEAALGYFPQQQRNELLREEMQQKASQHESDIGLRAMLGGLVPEPGGGFSRDPNYLDPQDRAFRLGSMKGVILSQPTDIPTALETIVANAQRQNMSPQNAATLMRMALAELANSADYPQLKEKLNDPAAVLRQLSAKMNLYGPMPLEQYNYRKELLNTLGIPMLKPSDERPQPTPLKETDQEAKERLKHKYGPNYPTGAGTGAYRGQLELGGF